MKEKRGKDMKEKRKEKERSWSTSELALSSKLHGNPTSKHQPKQPHTYIMQMQMHIYILHVYYLHFKHIYIRM